MISQKCELIYLLDRLIKQFEKLTLMIFFLVAIPMLFCYSLFERLEGHSIVAYLVER